MAHFLRGKQAGIQNDLSGGIHSDLFVLDDVRNPFTDLLSGHQCAEWPRNLHHHLRSR